MILEDTIAAIATPPGLGGIAVVRVSGVSAITTVDRIFSGKTSLQKSSSHAVQYGRIVDPNSMETVDTVLVTIMRAPHSYTGEDTAEISCHGGQLNTKKILELTLSNGARLAVPGEFTRMAYLNGRLDLTQVEAIADLIHAKTEAARRASAAQIVGSLADEIRSLRSELIQVCSLMEIDLDFAEENLINIERNKILSAIQAAKKRLQGLLETYRFGHFLREGAQVNLVGPPNVGKSSLLNALIKKNRAIVSDVPGTTRDYIEEGIEIDGLPIILRDTAGLRDSQHQVESIGIDFTKEHLAKADLNILVVDASEPVGREAREAYHIILDCKAPFVVCLNKIDKADPDVVTKLEEGYDNTTKVSAKTFDGLDQLRGTIRARFSSDISFDSPMISRLRHKEAITKSLSYLLAAEDTVSNKLSNEFATVDVRAAVESLGEIIGEVSTDDVLNNIFSNFCIGK